MSNRFPEKLSEADANLYFILALRDFLGLKNIKGLVDEGAEEEDKADGTSKGKGKRGPRKTKVPFLQVIDGGKVSKNEELEIDEDDMIDDEFNEANG